jgi:16S rRNA (guanine(966)-N(2))-methyltransferase RsmD
LRIIAGKYKSRRICLPKSNPKRDAIFPLRPTSDRARETLFDVLINYIEFDSVKCLDLFAGTGALGLEALSRGAGSCCFVDVSKEALNSIKKTADELGCNEDVELVRGNAIKYLSENKSAFFDIIFADSPYSYDDYYLLAEKALMLNPQIFVLEISSGLEQTFNAENYDVIEKKAGSAKFIIFILK